MAETVYVLCALTSVGCTLLLLNGHRQTRQPLLFWSGLCFLCFAVNNLLLLCDLVFEPSLDFSVARNLVGFVGVALLLFGVLWTQPKELQAS